jgi:hypothetical protein
LGASLESTPGLDRVETLLRTPESLPFPPLQLGPLQFWLFCRLGASLAGNSAVSGVTGNGGGSFRFDDLCPYKTCQWPRDNRSAPEGAGSPKGLP